MKIAIVTDDGQSISAHFGRARAYAVLTVRDGAVVERELRPKSALTSTRRTPMTTPTHHTTARPPTPVTTR